MGSTPRVSRGGPTFVADAPRVCGPPGVPCPVRLDRRVLGSSSPARPRVQRGVGPSPDACLRHLGPDDRRPPNRDRSPRHRGCADPGVARALVPGWDFVEDDSTPQDTFGHGTWVASAIAAQGNNGQFGAGYCWGCGLMPVRISDGHVAADTGVIARAIRWAVDHGARVITISLTGQGDDPVERAAVDYATAHNVLVVASAGNTGDDEIVYPAAYPGVLSVTGTDPRDRLYKWSARGTWIALAAPGCATVVHVVVGAAVACGSSFAPPAIAGIAGLLLSLEPRISASRLSDVLRATGRPVAGLLAKRVDAQAALAALGLATPIESPPQPQPAASAREATTVSGVMTSTRDIRFSTAVAGRLEVQFVSVIARECSMQMRLNGQVIVAFRGEERILTLEAQVPRGAIG